MASVCGSLNSCHHRTTGRKVSQRMDHDGPPFRSMMSLHDAPSAAVDADADVSRPAAYFSRVDNDFRSHTPTDGIERRPIPSESKYATGKHDGGGERNGGTFRKIVVAILRLMSICTYLVTWVANSEMLQGISNGKLFPSGIPYDKPAAITWFSYNFMLLSFAFVVPYVRFFRGRRRRRDGRRHDDATTGSFRHYVLHVWAGRLGFARALMGCAAISYTLLALNVCFIVGLGEISVSTSNAVFQLQTPLTVGLSVWILRDGFRPSEALGVVVSTVGVASIVLPPLSSDNGDNGGGGGDRILGVASTVLAAALGAVYLVSWRILSERKDPVPPVGGEGLADALTTTGFIGLTNLVAGWIALPAMHLSGLETFELPPPSRSCWTVLVANALVEYSFDVSCAVAIYATSAVVTAVTAPLTIPLALLADGMIYGGGTGDMKKVGTGWDWGGAALILVGAVLLEIKPDLFSRKREKVFHSDLKESCILSESTRIHCV